LTRCERGSGGAVVSARNLGKSDALACTLPAHAS
jgi:hypothetical protein